MSRRTSVSFTEEMKGHIGFGESDFDRGEEQGKADDTPLMFRLTIATPDFDTFARDPRHEAMARGHVKCDALGGRLPLERGVFNLFVDESGRRDKRMLYRLHFRDGAGHPLTLSGHKVVRDDIGRDVWRDTTSLFTRIYAGHLGSSAEDESATLVASGNVYIGLLDFGRQLLTFRARGGPPRARAAALLRFGALFSASLWTVYAPRADNPRVKEPPPRPRQRWRGPLPTRPGDQLRHRIVPFRASDGLEANLVHIESDREPTRGPVLLVHGAGVRANLFRSPVRTTFVEYLAEQGYDVWLENWRASIDLPPNPWTLDQAALYDHPRAVEKVVEKTGAGSVKAVIHCQGSTSFMMSAVAGLLPQVSTVVTNAVSLHPVVPPISEFKIKQLLPVVGRLTRYLNPQWGLEADTVVAKALNLLVQLTHHECANPVCKWASFTYGMGIGFPTLWAHENLNEETHDWLKEEFAHVPVTFFEQMARCIEAGHLVSVEGDRMLPGSFVAQAPQTDARFAFLAGENNRCFLPISQKRTFDFFERHRSGYHTFHVLRGYGHLDPFLGKNASRDVYPLIAAELAR